MKPQRLIILAAVFAGALLLYNVAQADQYGSEYQTFSQMIRKAQQGKGTPFYTVTLHEGDNGKPATLTAEIVARLQYVAEEQAQIWADTILEGDYVADGVARLDRVEGVYQENQMVGYRITYSERAWYVGQCEYDYETESSLAGCTEGRIIESTFVSPAFDSWLRDDLAMAEFERY